MIDRQIDRKIDRQMKIEKVMCVCVHEREERLFMDLSKAFNKEELIYSFCEKGNY